MSERYIKKPESWKDLMAVWVKSPGIRENYLKVVVKETWKKEMGPLITKYTQSLKIRKGVLIIKVSSAPLKNDLFLHREKIIKMLNDAAGEVIVKDVEIV